MTDIYDVNPNMLIDRLAKELKSQIKAPEWAVFVKTGVHKERPPVSEDWWQVRAAAILRTIAILGPIGTSKLRTKYGGKQNRGHKTEHFYKGSGAVIRRILQQLEEAGLVKQTSVGVHKGRIITPAGQSLLTRASEGIPASPAKVIKERIEKAVEYPKPEQKDMRPKGKPATPEKAEKAKPAPKVENGQ
jgi:small subunit ribosomal protein S19e